MARAVLLLFLVPLADHAVGDRSEKQESRQHGYPMMNKYLELLRDNTESFDDEFQDLDELGQSAEHESKRFGNHVDLMNDGIDNFIQQVSAFRQLLSNSAKSQIAKTKQTLKKGQWISSTAAEDGEKVGIWSGS